MSFILDALKKSQPQTQQQLPNINSAPPVTLEVEDNADFNWWPVVIVALIGMAALVGYLLGQLNQPQSHTVATVGQQPVVTQQQPQATQRQVTPATQQAQSQLVQSQPGLSQPTPAQSQLAAKFNQPAQANQVKRPEPYVPPEPEGIPVESVASMQAQEDFSVSDDVLKRFNQALAETDLDEGYSQGQPDAEVYDEYSDIPMAADLPARIQRALPSLVFSQHMYASVRQERWVKVNDQQIFEGQWISSQLQLVRIEPRYVVMAFDNEQFRLPALTDW